MQLLSMSGGSLVEERLFHNWEVVGLYPCGDPTTFISKLVSNGEAKCVNSPTRIGPG